MALPVPKVFDDQKLYTQLVLHEGKKAKPYVDTVGKITIGIGRNLTDVGLSEDEIQYLFNNDKARTIKDLDNYLPWWRGLDEVRRRVLFDMCFNMGIGTLRTFKNTLNFIQKKMWTSASQNMLASKWATQVGQRAKRLADMMETGKDYQK